MESFSGKMEGDEVEEVQVARAPASVCGQALEHLEVDMCLLTQCSWLVPNVIFLLFQIMVLMFSDY